MKTFDLPKGVPGNHPAGEDSVDPARFGLLLRGQMSSESGKATTSSVQPESALPTGKSFATIPASDPAEQKPADDRKAFASEEKQPAATGQAAQPLAAPLGRGPESSDTPASRDDATRPAYSAEAAGATESGEPLPVLGTSATEANASERAEAGTGISGPKSTSDSFLDASLAADRKAAQPAPVGGKDHARCGEKAQTPKTVKSQTTGKGDAVRSHPDSHLIHADGFLNAQVPGQAEFPAAAPSQSPVTGASCETGGTSGEDSKAQAVRNPAAASLQPLIPRAEQEPGGRANHRVEEAGIGTSDTTGSPAATHDAQAEKTAAAQQRMSPMLRSVGWGAADGQNARPMAAPTPVQGAVSPQIIGPVATAPHRSLTSPDLSLRPSAAFDRMDAAEPVRVLESSPQNLAVGIRDGGLGWIEIRTHAVTGQVSATLASGSSEAHTAITAELPAIREALTSQQIALHSLAAERFPTSAGGGSASSTPESGTPPRQSSVKPKGQHASPRSEAEGESLSYISVRV